MTLSLDCPRTVPAASRASELRHGTDDVAHPFGTSQQPLFRTLGTPAAKKRHVILDSGHVPPWPDVVRETLDWLDRYLGPVARRDGAAAPVVHQYMPGLRARRRTTRHLFRGSSRLC